ncbi:MAG: EamA family transporter, partial [Candidatus Nanohaloarchaea archaeon]
MAAAFVVLALLAAAGYAVANVVDKVVLTDHLDRSLTRVFWGSVFAPVIALPLAAVVDIHVLPPRLLAGALLAGVLVMGGSVLTWTAVQRGEVSRMTLVFKSLALFTVPLSVLLLGTVLSTTRFLGLLVLVAVVMLAS